MDRLPEDIRFRVLEGKFIDGHGADLWRDSGPHADPFSRLYYIDGGRGDVEYAGRTYSLRAGRFYLFPANYPILHRSSPGLVQYYVHFMAHIPGALSLFDVTRWICDLPAGDRAAARRGMRLIIDRPSDPAGILRAQSELQGAVAGFLKGMAKDLPQGAGSSKRFGVIVEYIHEHLRGKIAMGDLARIASLHPNYFSNLFKETFGVSPSEYILRKRIERAQLLLWQTEQSVKEIADAVGCEGAAYFCRIFKRRVGMTPREYRMQRAEGRETEDGRQSSVFSD